MFSGQVDLAYDNSSLLDVILIVQLKYKILSILLLLWIPFMLLNTSLTWLFIHINYTLLQYPKTSEVSLTKTLTTLFCFETVPVVIHGLLIFWLTKSQSVSRWILSYQANNCGSSVEKKNATLLFTNGKYTSKPQNIREEISLT